MRCVAFKIKIVCDGSPQAPQFIVTDTLPTEYLLLKKKSPF